MYAVVGCGECGALWVVEGRPDSTGCPRCGRRHAFDTLRRLAETADASEARRARAALLARRQGREGTLAELEPIDDPSALVHTGPHDDAYLDALGVDADAVQAAGERATAGHDGGPSGRLDVVRAALRELEAPDEGAVLGFAADRGVAEAAARDALDRLVRRGVATEDGGTYRLV